jgi:hypothetical protein
MTKKLPPEKRKKRGRKSKFNPDKHPKLVKELAEAGKTNTEIAEALNISTATLDAWMNNNPEFLSAIKKGKDYADGKVVDSLFERANGGKKIIEKRVIQNPDGTMRKEITEKELPSDPTAQIFWLSNRRPDDWKRMGREGMTQVDIQVILAESNMVTEIFMEALRNELDPESCQRVIGYIKKRKENLSQIAATG